jgi:hypothetical protein
MREWEEIFMSAGSPSWIDRWWGLLLIVFGLIFISALVFFKPMH